VGASVTAETDRPARDSKLDTPERDDERAARNRTVLWVALLGAFSAVSAIVMALAVFPAGSVNDDEAIYRLQARTIASGHLFPAAPDPPRAFVPWLAAVVNHHYVLKYTPVEAAVLAASHVLTGSYVPALVATVVALVGATWLLAWELLGDRREALIATAVVAFSPLVVVESGLLLGYLTTLVLLVFFTWAVVRGVRRYSGGLLVLAGLTLGIAGAIRPYDALVFAAPLLVWAAWRVVGAVARIRALLWLVAGGVGPLAAFLAYNDMATGSAFKLPFNLMESHDTIGFGLRRLTPAEDYHHFGPIQGIYGVGTNLFVLMLWVAGGPLLIALAVTAIRRGRLRGAQLAVAATAVSVPVCYVFFWGPWNAGTRWGGIWLIGPFYLLPLVIAAGMLGARGFTIWAREHPRRTRAAVAAMAILTVVVTGPAVAADARYSRQDGQITTLVDSVPGPALVVLSDNPGFVMFPHWNLGNIGHSTVPVLYVAGSGTAADFDLLQRFSDRVPYAIIFSGASLPYRAHLGVQLNRLVEVRGTSFDLRAQASNERLHSKALALTVSTGGARVSCGRPDSAGGWWLHVGPTGDVLCTGGGASILLRAGPSGSIRLRYLPKRGSTDQVDIPERVSAGGVTLLLPDSTAALLRHVTQGLSVTLFRSS
jgi:hypothetical protein